MAEIQVFEGIWEEVLANNARLFAGKSVRIYVEPEDREQIDLQEDRTLALLAQWRCEDQTDDPVELDRRDALARELEQNIERNPLALRMP